MLTRLLACSLVLLLPATAVAEGDALCESLSELFDADEPYQQYAFLNDDQLQSLEVALGQSKCTQYPRVSVLCSAEVENTNDYSVAKSWTEALQAKSDALIARMEACQSFEGWRPQEVEQTGSATYPIITKQWVNHGRDLKITLNYGFARRGKKGSASYQSRYGISFEEKTP
ncbi:hypothetical protein [Henriciella litoralis]|uniref:hypothetical protein n=1 Tax=Henriciella litoralis TaxID=568102 RepID=UPI000A013D85|nr:hypothetical protein [Henriciella litoralis]